MSRATDTRFPAGIIVVSVAAVVPSSRPGDGTVEDTTAPGAGGVMMEPGGAWIVAEVAAALTVAGRGNACAAVLGMAVSCRR